MCAGLCGLLHYAWLCALSKQEQRLQFFSYYIAAQRQVTEELAKVKQAICTAQIIVNQLSHHVVG